MKPLLTAMSEADLKRIEDALGRPLPEAFRRVMLNFPQRLIDAATFTDPDGNPYLDDMPISPNAEAILSGIEYRRSDSDWPQDYIVVGCNGCGEEYSVDISEESCPVYMSGPHNIMASSPSEEGYFELMSSDLLRWVGLDRQAG